jgi:hypothetical protein
MKLLRFSVIPECLNRESIFLKAIGFPLKACGNDRKNLLWVFFFVLFLFQPALFADDTPVSVKAEVNKAVITIGDPLKYKVTIKHDPSVQVSSTVPVPAPDVFKVQKAKDIKEKEGEKQVVGREYTLTAFQLGDFILEPVKIEYRIGSAPAQTIETERIYISVQSVAKGEEKTDIRGIKPTFFLKGTALWIFLLIVLAVLGIAGFFIYRRFAKGQPLIPTAPEPVLTPEDKALTELNRLFDSDLLSRGKTKEYYLHLSEILRAYFESRFHILAVESTTYEIMRALSGKEMDRELRVKIEEVLESADLAKFAKWVPEPTQVVQINQKSKQIIEDARPKEVVGGI